MTWPGLTEQPSSPWRLLGIPIRVDASWFFILAFMTWSLSNGYFPSTSPGLPAGLYWVMGLVAALCLYLCVLLHELGHSVVARSHGMPVTCVTLFLFGGVAQIARDARRPSVELKVALTGPLVSALIAGACLVGAPAIHAQRPLGMAAAAIVRYLGLINTGILVFNLLPGFPLDGGRVLRALLWAWTRSLRRATQIASTMGSVLGLTLLVLGGWAITHGAWFGGVWYLLLGLFLRRAARASYRQAQWMTS